MVPAGVGDLAFSASCSCIFLPFGEESELLNLRSYTGMLMVIPNSAPSRFAPAPPCRSERMDGSMERTPARHAGGHPGRVWGKRQTRPQSNRGRANKAVALREADGHKPRPVNREKPGAKSVTNP